MYLKTPLDVAFARQLIRDYSDKSVEEMINWTKSYLDSARNSFIDHDNFISEDVDLVIDGTLPLIEQLNSIKKVMQVTN